MSKVWQDLGKRPLVVASLSGGERLVDSARRAAGLGADLLEIRVDSLKPKERANIGKILEAIKESCSLPIISTVRSAAEQDPASKTAPLEDRERKILFEDALSLVDAIDVEIESDSLAQDAVRIAKKSGKKIILSYHDFKGIPSADKLAKLEESFRALGGDIFKIAGMAKEPGDVLKMLGAAREANGFPRVTIAMGDHGRISRVTGFLYGSALTYGYMNKPTAPGQLSVRELVDLCALFYPSYRRKARHSRAREANSRSEFSEGLTKRSGNLV